MTILNPAFETQPQSRSIASENEPILIANLSSDQFNSRYADCSLGIPHRISTDMLQTTNMFRCPHVSTKKSGRIYHNLPVAALVEHALRKGEGRLASTGALCVETGKYTGRSPKDRFIVDQPHLHNEIDWNHTNQPISEEAFEELYHEVLAALEEREIYIFDGYVGADPNYRFGVRVINERASQNLFARQLFLRPTAAELADYQADFTVIAVPELHVDPAVYGLHSEAFVVLNLSQGIVLIGGTGYAGEIKKSIFTLMNYHMPQRNVLPMHSAANVDAQGHTALFFGLSGTGKTSLSVDGDRFLIGDDEHGWSESGIFNFEGGCYAKTIHLSQEYEPQIWSAVQFGTVLENVVLDPQSRTPDYDDGHLTENTRAAYPLNVIERRAPTGVGYHPDTILFLAADAFGVLPPIARLTREQAMYHFLSGYTSKLAGTERGITTPQSTFSACFGQCFFPLPPTVYAEMLGEKLLQHPETRVFLVNTGWSGGSYGIGKRIAIAETRAMVNAALNGDLDRISYTAHPIFQILVPDSVPGVSPHLLDPKRTWADPIAYDQQARALAQRFVDNFRQFKQVSPAILAAAPLVN